jgi:conjugal transfer pilus assembly protein TraL
MDKSEQDDFYRVSRYLNKPRYIMGCTMDEFIPAVILILTGLILSWLFSSLLLASVWIFSIKFLKRKYGAAFLMVGWYWHTSAALSRNVFPHTPPSEYKFWLR